MGDEIQAMGLRDGAIVATTLIAADAGVVWAAGTAAFALGLSLTIAWRRLA